MKVGLLGFGAWGENLARNFSSLHSLGAICDTQESRRQKAASLYSHIPIYKEYSRLLQDSEISAIVVATPAITHYKLALNALYAEKDVFVEKPLALCVNEGETLVQVAREKQRILMVGHLMEYHGAIIRLVELIQNGTLGALEYLYSTRVNLGKVRREENALWSFAPHDIAVFLRLIGLFPIQVSAVGGAYIQPSIADVTVTHLLFPGQIRAHLFVSWLHPFKEQKLIVIGTKKMAMFDDMRTTEKLLLYDRQVSQVGEEFISTTVVPTPIYYEPYEPLQKECAHFLACIRSRKQPLTDGAEGLRVLKILAAGQASLEKGGIPVLFTGEESSLPLQFVKNAKMR